jgi:hypothetical protein
MNQSFYRVFLSHASEDKPLAKGLARAFMRKGLDTWVDDWEIAAGDSIRQKIQLGIDGASHFLVLLTQTSITKAWVNQEIDAAFLASLEGSIRFIPVRYGLPLERVPSMLRSRHCPEITDLDSGAENLAFQILRLTDKPELGVLPHAARLVAPTGWSKAASAIARSFVERSQHAIPGDIMLYGDELAAAVELPPSDIEDALHELRGYLRKHEYTGDCAIDAKAMLYVEFDRWWKPWNPEEDALRIAVDMESDDRFPQATQEISRLYGWPARRLNPALAYLIDQGAVMSLADMDGGDFIAIDVRRTDATRRFVRTRS